VSSRKAISSIIDLIAMIIENASPELSAERVAELLGRDSVLMKIVSEGSATTKWAGAPGAGPTGLKEEHCYECSTVHLGTAKILIREALERFDRGGPAEVIVEKLRRAYEELIGAEDDLRGVHDDRTRQLLNKVKDVRKFMYDHGLLVEPRRELVAQALSKVVDVADEVYKELEVRKERLIKYLRQLKEKISKAEEELSKPRRVTESPVEATGSR